MEEGLHKELKRLALERGTTVSHIIEELVSSHIEKGGFEMIKFRNKDGDTSFSMNDEGELKFQDKNKEKELELAEKAKETSEKK